VNHVEPQLIADALSASGELTAARVDDTNPDYARVLGSAEIGGVTVHLRVDLRPPFPAAQPVVSLAEPNALGDVPHVDSSGEVCYLSDEGRILDWRHPDRIVVECVRRAKSVLSASMTDADEGDYADEFEAHWRQQGGEAVVSIVDPGDEVCEVVGAEMGGRIVLARSVADVEAFENHQLKHVTRHTGLFIPLVKASPFTPLPELSDLAQIRRAIWAGLSDKDTGRLQRQVRNRSKNSDHVILQLPRPAGEPSLVGLRFDGIEGKHPLCEGGAAHTIKPLRMIRCDRAYLMPRAGAATLLSERRVCVIGCGAVGSRLVDQLVHTGITNLMLVDPDDLAPENTYRHLLGRKYWGTKKAEALSEWVKDNVPYVRIRPIGEDILSLLERVPVSDMTDLDLIIFATGNHTAELAANAALSGKTRPPMLFTWLEPLGIGGHALLSPRDAAGCLECVYTDSVGGFCENRMSFAAGGQTFSLDTSGCGSRFTPFSNIDAETTSLLAARLAIDFLSGALASATAVSWKGDPSRFLAAGFGLSDRYHCASTERVTGFESAQCPTCGCGRLFGV